MEKYFNNKKQKENEGTPENLLIEEQQNQNDNDNVDEQKENEEMIEPTNVENQSRMSCEQLHVENNGLFLQMIEMVAEFDLIIREHIRRAQAHASHEEQMSLVIRCVDESMDSSMVKEYWIEFLKVDDTSGLGLSTELTNVLTNLKLDVDNIRGQGYNNGANMSGRHKGVQKRLLETNPRAFYTPCGCHSLNLALCDMANYKVEGLTLKPLSETRWESHVKSVKPIKEQYVQIRDALLDLINIAKDPKTKSEAESLATHEPENFEFLLGMIIWYKLLHALNTVSKFFQAENMDIDEAIKLLEALILFLENYRESGFASAMDEAKQIGVEMGIEAVFQEKRNIRRKMQFDESGSEEVTQSAEESFQVDYFLFIIDQARSSLQTSLLKSCKNLEQYLSHNGHSDIIGDNLCTKFLVLKCYLPGEIKRVIDVLNHLKKMNACFPNACIAYKILLTIPVTLHQQKERRLNGLAMLSIEEEIVKELDYTKLIDIFASKTARRVVFK
ncbi:uncharacterized protein LOC111365742 [Olea europaea var. sylvestris]|uniref:uncharacterized protein LOC111365742 n=1 Tax=Olea europaea var. sylvestris TaxID=158386 RepID=UPI000C1D5386|nr:uncharacterized protein LOC111365742 [Olea europaea var. sylvestris]